MERELWRIISKIINRLDRRLSTRRLIHSAGRILRVYLWAVLHDRPVSWACQRRHWIGVRPPPRLPHQSTMSRRLAEPGTPQMLQRLAVELDRPVRHHLLKYLDGKPLTVARHSQDRQAGFGRGAGGIDRGYKIHAIYGDSARPLALRVCSLRVDERRVAHDLIPQLDQEGYVLADAAYDANALHQQAADHGQVLLTPRRYRHARGLGRRRHSPHRLDALARLDGPSRFVPTLLGQRRCIQTRFANLTSFGGGLTCLPPWVRGRRVEPWVRAKIVVRLARDQQIRRA